MAIVVVAFCGVSDSGDYLRTSSLQIMQIGSCSDICNFVGKQPSDKTSNALECIAQLCMQIPDMCELVLHRTFKELHADSEQQP